MRHLAAPQACHDRCSSFMISICHECLDLAAFSRFASNACSHGSEATLGVSPAYFNPSCRDQAMATSAVQLQEILAARRRTVRRKGRVGCPKRVHCGVRGELGGMAGLGLEGTKTRDQGRQPGGVHRTAARRGERYSPDRGRNRRRRVERISAKPFAILGPTCRGEARTSLSSVDDCQGRCRSRAGALAVGPGLPIGRVRGLMKWSCSQC